MLIQLHFRYKRPLNLTYIAACDIILTVQFGTIISIFLKRM